MRILRIIFLILSILIPSFFILIIGTDVKKFKKKKKYRKNIIKIITGSFIVNFAVFLLLGFINNYDRKDDISSDQEIEEKQDSNYTPNGYKIETIDGITYIDGVLIVNKSYPLPNDYLPKNTQKEVTNNTKTCEECINKEAYNSFMKMKKDAASKGLSIWIASGYRSYSYQNGLYKSYVNKSGKDAADTYSARAGYSEHQSGYAFDLNTVDDSFKDSKEGKWVNENCYKYGFIIRYPQGKDNETGYKYEPWHLRYVGVELAEKLYNDGEWTTLEEHFGIESKYNN